ncbi:MAG: hypothetical protein LBB09_00980 [Rickettsiales bacterium]|jgi:hypothetical protein|nr:hypothetical protein [Rickettsiales bacterium]
MIKKIKERILTFKNMASSMLREGFVASRAKILESYEKCKDGEEKMNTVLIWWSAVPCALYIVARMRFAFWGFFAFILDLSFFVLGLLDYYFISKAVSKHPEYDGERMEKIRKIEYYNSITEEEYEKIKKEEKKGKGFANVKNLLLTKNWRKAEPFKIVKIFLILVILITFRRLFLL